MLIYKIARHIIITTSLNWDVTCTFPEGNGTIIASVSNYPHELLHVQRVELDPEAPKQAQLTITSKALRTTTSKNEM
jgi:hypothetical protein